MKNFFIIHGSDGHSKENWFPWLKSELEKKGFECIVPDFPNVNGKHYLDQWYHVIDKYKDKITNETVFITHSRGTSFILNLLMDYDLKISSLYIVGGFVEYLWQEEGKPLDSFFARPFDYVKIKNNCKEIINFQSDNDPYIPVEHGLKVSKLLNAQYVLVKGAGHFNTTSGYTKFPQLLESL